MPCQTDKLVSGLPDDELNPLTTSARGGRGSRCGNYTAEEGKKREKEKEVVPVHCTVPLAASESPSPACVLPPPPACLRRLRAARIRGKQRRVVWTGWEWGRGGGGGGGIGGGGLLLLLLLVLVLSGALTNKRQTDNKNRQNTAYQADCWSHGGDRSPCFGHALMLCCILSFWRTGCCCCCSSCVSEYFSFFYFKPGQVAG